jgi:hypothetical protein
MPRVRVGGRVGDESRSDGVEVDVADEPEQLLLPADQLGLVATLPKRPRGADPMVRPERRGSRSAAGGSGGTSRTRQTTTRRACRFRMRPTNRSACLRRRRLAATGGCTRGRRSPTKTRGCLGTVVAPSCRHPTASCNSSALAQGEGGSGRPMGIGHVTAVGRAARRWTWTSPRARSRRSAASSASSWRPGHSSSRRCGTTASSRCSRAARGREQPGRPACSRRISGGVRRRRPVAPRVREHTKSWASPRHYVFNVRRLTSATWRC